MLVWPFILILVGLNVVEREDGKGGPQSRRANALPATREKHKIKAERCLNVFGRKSRREQREREKERGMLGETVMAFRVHGPRLR